MNKKKYVYSCDNCDKIIKGRKAYEICNSIERKKTKKDFVPKYVW